MVEADEPELLDSAINEIVVANDPLGKLLDYKILKPIILCKHERRASGEA